jgi:hypothetical protein
VPTVTEVNALGQEPTRPDTKVRSRQVPMVTEVNALGQEPTRPDMKVRSKQVPTVTEVNALGQEPTRLLTPTYEAGRCRRSPK